MRLPYKNGNSKQLNIPGSIGGVVKVIPTIMQPKEEEVIIT
jgi:hypothetical protein